MMDTQYPVGRFDRNAPINDDQIPALIESLRTLPHRLAEMLHGASLGNLSNTYREGGWTGLQVIHHIADSHMNAYMRFKLALTEDHPTIRPYSQDAWAETADNQLDAGPSVMIIRGVHERWSVIMDTMSPRDFDRTFHHPEQNRDFSLRTTLGLYEWHGRHHLEHIRICLNA